MRTRFLILGLLIVVFSLAATWNKVSSTRTMVPGNMQHNCYLVLKQFVNASDSTTKYVKVGSDTTIRVLLGYLPARSYIQDLDLYTVTAFNSTGSDSCSVGTSADIDYYLDETSVSATGVDDGTVLNGYLSSGSAVYLYYRKTAVAAYPTAGKTGAILKYTVFPD